MFAAALMPAVYEAQAAMARAQQKVMQDCSLASYQPGRAIAYRCAYCRTLDSASVHCPSCGAPR